jgi:hypothetical protein
VKKEKVFGSSTTGLQGHVINHKRVRQYFSHPQSQYLGVGKIQKDQLADYAGGKHCPWRKQKGG